MGTSTTGRNFLLPMAVMFLAFQSVMKRGTWCTISASRQAQGRRTARKGQPFVAKFAPDLPCGGEDRQAGLGARPIITGLGRSPLRSLSSALCVPQILEQDRCKQMKGGMCRCKAMAEFLFCVACNGHNTRRLLTRKQSGYCRFRFRLRQGQAHGVLLA